MKKICGLLVLVIISACSPKEEDRGYVNFANWKEDIKIGQTSKQEVIDKFGSPSATSSFGNEEWFYITTKKESYAFLKPKITEHDIADIEFDSAGIVSSVKFYNKDDAKQVALVKRITPTEGHSITFIDQTLGNLGRFNSPNGGRGYSNRHGGPQTQTQP